MADKFRIKKIATHELRKGDRLEIAGKMFEVVEDVRLGGLGSNRLMITLQFVGGHPIHDRASLFLVPHQKITITRKKK